MHSCTGCHGVQRYGNTALPVLAAICTERVQAFVCVQRQGRQSHPRGVHGWCTGSMSLLWRSLLARPTPSSAIPRWRAAYAHSCVCGMIDIAAD